MRVYIYGLIQHGEPTPRYIGITEDIITRRFRHENNKQDEQKHRWLNDNKDIIGITILQVLPKWDFSAENKWIAKFKPMYNIHGNPATTCLVCGRPTKGRRYCNRGCKTLRPPGLQPQPDTVFPVVDKT